MRLCANRCLAYGSMYSPLHLSFSGTGHHMAAACAVEQAVPETGSFAPFVDRRIPETWATCATLIEYDDA
jgi:hypothetical protein